MNLPTIEQGLLSSVTTLDDLRKIAEAKPRFKMYERVYELIVEYAAAHGTTAPESIIQTIEPEWTSLEGSFDYWYDKWIAGRRAFMLRNVLHQALNDTDKDEELVKPAAIIDSLQRAFGEIVASDVRDAYITDAMIAERYDKYTLRSQHFGSAGFQMWGIPTGIGAIDGSRQGWMPGELIGFYARPTVGKTWMLLREGVIAWLSGKRILLITPEMTPEQVALRTDALLAGHMGIPFSHSKVFAGDPSVQASYEQLASSVRNENRWYTVSDIGGREVRVSDTAALISRYKPDLVLIDGVSLLGNDQRSTQEWEKMKHVCYDLKRLTTVARVAMIVSHQAVNSRRGQRSNRDDGQGRGDDWVMPTLNDAAFGDAFVQAMSTVITMAPDRDSEFVRWYSIRKSRERNLEFKPRQALGWAVDRGQIVDLERCGEDITAITNELRSMGIIQ